ncbi:MULTISPECIES: hypothetical protein [unclassified Natrinema]|uniref:DUF7573 domain-containing protein n=1 Tax=unclassified Natrinema TaxID=2622230 RepID=UPI00026D5119|nr:MULTISPECIES: hypothetical protein [unclassified Natrinema]AFO58135.1 hypothetical protein NJ7G_2907 [Natrinema sp. J7-2]
MTDDARLSEFATATDDGEPTRAARADDDSSSAAAEASPAGETARSTYAWGEYTCSRCGKSTDRVWRGDDSLVCPACKDW